MSGLVSDVSARSFLSRLVTLGGTVLSLHDSMWIVGVPAGGICLTGEMTLRRHMEAAMQFLTHVRLTCVAS